MDEHSDEYSDGSDDCMDDIRERGVSKFRLPKGWASICGHNTVGDLIQAITLLGLHMTDVIKRGYVKWYVIFATHQHS